MIIKCLCTKKIITLLLIVSFVLPSFSTTIFANPILNSTLSNNSNQDIIIEPLTSIFNNSADGKRRDIVTNSWTQLVGNYPNGMLDNGFNNSNNINVRGKSTFTVNETDYLFIGTGNINKKQEINKIVFFPFIKAMIFLIKMFLETGITFFTKLILHKQKLLDFFVINSIESYFKQLTSDGCELWYYCNDSTWIQSVGNQSDSLIRSGFNNSKNLELTVLTPFQTVEKENFLYAGTWNPKQGCELWRSSDPVSGTWEPIIHRDGIGYCSSGFGNVNNTAAYASAILGDWLYIGTMNWENGCEIWRTDGKTWQQVVGGKTPISGLPNGFSEKNRFFNRNIYAWEMCTYTDSKGEALYVGTFNIGGCELWNTRDGVSWNCMIGDQGQMKRGFNLLNMPVRILNYGIRRMEVFNNSLYIGTASTPSFHFRFSDIDQYNNRITKISEILSPGFEIWKYDGRDFTKVVGKTLKEQDSEKLGFNDRTNAYCWSMETYNDCLFAGTMNPGVYLINFTEKWMNLIKCNISFQFTNGLCDFNSGGGCEIWYSENGAKWYQLIGDESSYCNTQCLGNGFDNHNNIGARILVTYKDKLYAGIMNGIEGCEVWSFDGGYYPEKQPIVNESFTFESNGYKLYGELYYPNTNKDSYPALVFCEGLPAYISAYSWLGKALAEKGYAVIMFDPPGLGKSEGLFSLRNVSFPYLNLFFRFGSYAETPYQYLSRHWTVAASDALDYLLLSSSLAGKIDSSKIGIIGHSLGGITATETAARDPRFKAVVALSHGNPLFMRRIQAPVQFICGGFDLALQSLPVSCSCYQIAAYPKEIIVLKRCNHIGFTTTFGSFCPCPDWQKEMIIRYATGWFDYFLLDKIEAYPVITSRTAYVSKLDISQYNFNGENILL